MTTKKPAAVLEPSTPKSPETVLAECVSRERQRTGVDVDLIAVLESTVLRADATEGAWDKAATAIRTLAASRAETRRGTQ